jgi:glycosyltransferase involved in cell wall biosynthesis
VGAANRFKGTVARLVRRGLTRWAQGGRPAEQPRVYILLMNAWSMGGTIRTALNLAGYLSHHHDVEVLSLLRRRNEPFFPFPPGVKVTVIDDLRADAAGSGLSGFVERRLRARSSVLINPADRVSLVSSLWTDVQIARKLRSRNAGVMISTRPGLNLLSASVAASQLVKIGQEHMNLSTHRPPVRRAIKRGYAGLDALATLTVRDLEEYRAALGDGPALTAIPNATPDLGGVRSDGSARTVMAAGRLTRQKAFALLIEAFAQVAAAHPEWQLLICGGGPRREHLEKLIDQLDVGANVTLAGPVRNLAAKMTEASIFALSSRFEGFPMVLLEAMSVGLPVVSFDCPTGPREIVEDGRNGLLVPEADIGALAAALIRMIEDDELRRRCSEGALETAGRYSIEAIGARWDELIEWLSHDRRS